MQSLAPAFSVSRHENPREIHWSAAGLWKEEDFLALQKELAEKAKPFIEDGRGFNTLGDLTDFVVQTREMAEKMRKSQDASAAAGVERMALICPSMLVRQQFTRVSGSLNIAFFENRADAIAWLRSRETAC
ncbi:STAS/SEC14 domain-containing protein [Erythrobacter sp.]|jgi:hypothetical protein|uniref:STAS/SEC14 domain-containing protein n=1 Tax=Erythrobacter sp. TaxID=1042 RepID=UPI002EA38628|nr:STAS/SEC14 domain-containing protein [Erythrobacter sp.]